MSVQIWANKFWTVQHVIDRSIRIDSIRSIQKSLTIESFHDLVRAMVLSRLDYCNGLLGGAPKSLLAQLSGVMWAAARLILVLPRQNHVTSEIRARLHWLDVPSRVQFKLCCLAFRCLHGSATPYLAGYFTPVSSIEGRSQLRSAAARLLLVPRTRTVTVGPRAFAEFLSCRVEQSPGRSSWSQHQSSQF